jgi:hypothetical protein
MESGHIDVSHLQLLIGLAGVVCIVMSGFWAMTKVVVGNFQRTLDERFALQEEARKEGQREWMDRGKRNEGRIDELEKELRRVLIETPKEYVSRGDYVRRETVIEAKIDQLSLRIQNWFLEDRR